MASPRLRSAGSALLLGLCLWGGWRYASLPERASPEPALALPPAPGADPTFHAPHRFELEFAGEGRESPCQGCHGPLPHWKQKQSRAFLNLHVPTLDCGACHLAGGAVAVRRFRGAEVVTGETLTAGEGGRLFAARREGERWTPLLTPGASARLVVAGPRCGECHRRGSTLLAGEGLYDPYRRRVLEDLAVLRRVGDSPW